MDTIARLGGDVGQSFFISKPLSGPDLDDWMAKSDWVRPKATAAE